MRLEPRWDRSAGDLRRARGEVIVALASYRAGDELRFATVSHAGAEEQRLDLEVSADRLVPVLARHAKEGFGPALVAMVGPAERPLVSLVLERVAAGAPAPRLLLPQPIRDAAGTFFATRAAREAGAGHVRAIAAVGTPRDARGHGIVVAAVWAPEPPVHVAWAVHVDAIAPGERYRDRWEVRTLETAARPVQAIPLRGSDGARWVVSLWHDRPIEPWPAPDPFAHGPRFSIDEVGDVAALSAAITRRRDEEDRRPLAIGAGEGGFLALHGAVGSEAPLGRRFFAIGIGDGDRPAHLPGAAREDESPAPAHPLDAWALATMRASGARHGQLVVVRRRKLVFARAYTWAEAGYPIATLDHALRLGSVSKALTALALLAEMEARGLDLDAPIGAADLLDLAPGDGPPRLAAVTVRALLTHHAGLRTFTDVRPDERRNPLSEHRLTALLDGAPRAAQPGELSAGLRAIRDDEPFAAARGRADYSNEGFILLGELLARLREGRADAYEEALAGAVLRPAGVDPGPRGCLLGAGRTRARARGESPAHPLTPTWVEKRFPGDDLDPGPLALSPYVDNGPFLGGAAGVAIPLLWAARAIASTRGVFTRRRLEKAAAPASPGSKYAHGFHLSEPAFWSFREPGGAARSVPMMHLHHNGRLDGGAALLVHLAPMDAREEQLSVEGTVDLSLTVLVAFNQLAPLYDEPHGRQILTILRKLEGTPGWAGEDLFAGRP